jgi:hypothetical protein
VQGRVWDLETPTRSEEPVLRHHRPLVDRHHPAQADPGSPVSAWVSVSASVSAWVWESESVSVSAWVWESESESESVSAWVWESESEWVSGSESAPVPRW